MEKKPKLEIKCCYNRCENDNSYGKKIRLEPFPKPCLQFRQNCVNGSIDQHIIHCKDCERASKWVECCGNSALKSIYNITSNLYVCSQHFFGGDRPSDKHPDPVPVIEIKKEPDEEMSEVDTHLIKEEKIETEEHHLEEIKEEDLNYDWMKKEEEALPQCSKPGSSAQTDFEGSFLSENSSESTCTSEDSTTMSRAEYFEQMVKQTKRKCFFYTGLYYNQICSLLKFFGTTPDIPGNKLTPMQQLIIVLTRLRRGFEIHDLAFRNDVSPKFLIEMIKTWVFFMHSQFAKRLHPKLPQKVDVNKLKNFHFLKNVSPLNNGGSMEPFVMVCACLLKFQPSGKPTSDEEW